MILLSGCGLLQLAVPPPPTPPPPPIRPTPEKLGPDVDAGLVPLPSPEQVVTTSGLGRRNPFAPVVVAAIPLPQGVAPDSPPAQAVAKVARAGGDASVQQLALQAALRTQAEAAAKAASGTAAAPGPNRPLVLQSPQNLQLTGVIQTNGQTEAVVTYGGQSGTLRPGDQGGRTTELLPAGWSVVAIHLGGRGQQDVPSLLLQKGRQRVRVRL
ncbi:MAG: hypothetical protein WAM11_16750 [Cyanobium sp.]